MIDKIETIEEYSTSTGDGTTRFNNHVNECIKYHQSIGTYNIIDIRYQCIPCNSADCRLFAFIHLQLKH